jgi:hypothetical protein
MNIFKTIFKLGNIRTALEKVYVTLKEGITIMIYVKEGFESSKPDSKYIEELKNLIKLCTTIKEVVGRILIVIGGTIDDSPVVAKSLATLKTNNVIDINKSINDLKNLDI